jgi:hypothetical protein
VQRVVAAVVHVGDGEAVAQQYPHYLEMTLRPTSQRTPREHPAASSDTDTPQMQTQTQRETLSAHTMQRQGTGDTLNAAQCSGEFTGALLARSSSLPSLTSSW